MKKIITLLFITSLLLMNNKQTHAQVTIEDINFQLRDMYKNLKRSPDSVPFLYDMSSHVLDDKLYRSYNDSDFITKGLFLTMYEEMRSAAYDTSILEPSELIEERMRKRSRNDTINISILNADYATFLDDAFKKEGQYYYLTDSSISDVTSRSIEPFLLKNVFVSTLTAPVSYFKKVNFRIDSAFVFTNKKFLGITNRDLDSNYARWRIDFGEGAGWREFNPKEAKHFNIMYPDTGLYEINIAVFHCDPYPLCNTYPSKLSKTSIYILKDAIPNEPDITYEFLNITVGLYKGCGETRGGVYIPLKPLIVVEGIDLLNTRSIPVLYADNIHIESSKKLGLLSTYNYDFYVVNFNNTRLDMRENAMGIVELLDYLKSIIPTNEQFVVFAESMGGIIARYALTYMENDLYTQNPNSHKPTQMHNTRLYISNDAPHQGATVPIAFQTFYRNVHNSMYFKIANKLRFIFPLIDVEKYWNDVLDSKSVQQLLAYHVDANGPHPHRVDFMNDLISLNPQNNGYPSYCKMMAFTDGLLSGQSQLDLSNNILVPGGDLAKLEIKLKLILFKSVKINLFEEKLTLKLVNKNAVNNTLVNSETRVLYRKTRGCLKHFLRGKIEDYVECVFNLGFIVKGEPQLNITSNYDTEAAGIFSTLSLLSSFQGSHNHFQFPFDVNSFVDVNSGIIKTSIGTSRFNPIGYIRSNEISAKLKISSFGFAFIPVHSAIDFDYYKTLNISTDYNLLQHNVQDFLFANSPFHVISGFNYNEIGYPKNASEHNNSKNWSHGYFTNEYLNDGTDNRYLNREIGDSSIYLNNFDLGIRNADYKFIKIYNGIQNPNYNYLFDSSTVSKNKNFHVYSKSNSFSFREPGRVNLNYQNTYNEGYYLINEGQLQKLQTSIVLCKSSTKRLTKSYKTERDLTPYPNPFSNSIHIDNLTLGVKYNISICNILGQKIISTTIILQDEDTFTIDTKELSSNNIYILSVVSENEILANFKIIK